jgi:hypothetical protein
MPRDLSSQTPLPDLLKGRWVKAVVLGKKCLNGASFVETQYSEISLARPTVTMDAVVRDLFVSARKNSMIPDDLIEGFEIRFVNGPPTMPN